MAMSYQEKSLRERIRKSPYRKQLELMLSKGSPVRVVEITQQEYESSRTLTDSDLDTLDRLLRKRQITDEEYDELVGIFEGKCVFSAYDPAKANDRDKTTKTLQEKGVLVTFANVDDTYCYVAKYFPKNPPQGIRVITFDSIIEQAETLGTVAILAWHVGDDVDLEKMTLYYDGREESFHRGCIPLHQTPEEMKRYEAIAKATRS